MSVLIVLAMMCIAAGAAEPQRPTLPPGTSQEWWSQVQADLRAEEYNVTAAGPETPGGHRALNRAHGFSTTFDGRGLEIAPVRLEEKAPTWSWGLELVDRTADGRRPAADVRVDGNRIEFARGWVTEWFVNDERGLEQGFTLPAPPPDSSAQHSALSTQHSIFLDLALSGTLHPKFAEDGQAVDFYATASTIAVLRYGSLKVTDATGRELPAHFEGFTPSALDGRRPTADGGRVFGGGIRIVVDDTGALYPVTVDPLAMSPAWTLTGSGSAYLGFRLAVAGDVNGDGYSDVLIRDTYNIYLHWGGPAGLQTQYGWVKDNSSGVGVATAGDVNGDGYSDALFFDGSSSVVALYLGGRTGLTASTALTCTDTTCSHSEFGTTAAAAGDVNGDGYGDVVVGAPDFGSTGPGYDNGPGKVFLYLGSSGGLSPSPAWTATGDSARDFLGSSVATAGDVNGDGYADVVAGAKGWADRPGKAYLYLGGPGGLSAAAAWTTSGEGMDDNFGAAVASIGDTDGDGFPEVVVAAPGYSTDAGRAYVYQGSASGLAATPFRTYTGEAAGDALGAALTTAGDVDGDGYADLALGAKGNASNKGEVYLYRGGPSGLAATSAWTAVGEAAGNEFGGNLAGGGDVNGDGFCDLLVAAPPFVANPAFPNLHNGRVYLYLGGPAPPPTVAGWTGSGEGASSYYGWSVASAGDVNGDGYTDVVVGAYFMNGGPGKAYLYLGGATGLSATAAWTATGEASADYFGMSVAGAGDVNGDGYADVVVGAKNHTFSTNYSIGKAYLYLGSASGLTTGAMWTATGEGAYSSFGASVAGAGDVNGDGYSDVVVGAPGNSSVLGKATLYLGHGGGLSSNPTWTATGEAASDNFATCVAGAGDVNGDGYSDVVVGAYGYGSSAGKAYLYLGGATGPASSAAWSQVGPASSRFGGSVATAGDVNGDGYSDVLVGASFYNSRAGRAYLYLGGTSGLATSAAWTVDGESGSLLGVAMAPAADVNGDGYSDVAVGAQGSGSVQGKAYLFMGSAAGLATTAAWTGAGAATTDRYGYAVGAADVNGDGYSDLLVGAPYNTSSAGRVYVYGGNGGVCLPLAPRQLRADGTTPIAPLGLAYDQEARLGARLRSPFGRGLAKLEWQAVPLHGSLSPAINPVQSLSRWYDSGLSGAARAELVDLSESTGPWTWRVRVCYNAATTALMPHSRWLSLHANGLRETDLRSTATAPPPPCVAPDEPCWLYSVVKVGTDYTLNWQDPNQGDQRTGWNIRRSNDPSVLPKSSWPLVGSNVVDMDAGTVNTQWTDHSGADPSPGTVWYYEVTTYNANCPAEGPF